jgi:type IV pilus assembly protein PilA
MTKERGFTLLEILLVIAAIGILASIVIVAINPNRQLAQARNAERRSEINSLLNGVYQYSLDNNGNLPVDSDTVNNTVDTTLREITLDTNVTCADADAGDEVNLNEDLVSTYLSAIPVDPQNSETNCSGYTIQSNGSTTALRITVNAPKAELSQTISVQK